MADLSNHRVHEWSRRTKDGGGKRKCRWRKVNKMEMEMKKKVDGRR